jgi:hypothetical protein
MGRSAAPRTGSARTRRGNLLGLCGAAAVLAAACARAPMDAPDAPAGAAVRDAGGRLKTLTGKVTRVEPPFEPSALRARPSAVAVKPPDAPERTFRVAESVDTRVWTLLHLNSHLRGAEPLLVVYEETPEGLVAVALAD